MVKAFLYKAALFLLILLGINMMLVYCYNELVMEQSLLRKRENTFLNNSKPIDFLFIGDSHTAAAINTRIIPKSLNYSGSGESYLQNYYKLKNTDKISNTPIKTVVLPLDYHSLSSFRKERLTDEGYWANKIDLLEMAITKREIVWLKKWLKGRCFPYMGELRNIFSAIELHTGKIEAQKIVDGVEQRTDRFLAREDKTENLEKALERHFKGSQVFDEELLKYLQQIFDYCENTNKNLILLRYPISTAYLQQLGNYIDLNAYEKQFQHLEKQIPSDIQYWDFSQLFEEQQDYFSDADHLNFTGAEAFSKILRDSLLKQ